MTRFLGGQRLVLNAVRDLAWDGSRFVTDGEIAENTRISIADVRDWIKTLADDGYVDLVPTTNGQSFAITAKGRLALRQGDAMVGSEEEDRLSLKPAIDLLDETNRLGRAAPGKKMGERQLGLVEVIQSRLESVHESYMEHFRRYREVIATWSGPFNPDHPIFDTLEKDHLFTQSDRLRLLAMTEAIPMLKEADGKKVIDPASASHTEKAYYGFLSFLSSIADYFRRTGYYGDSDGGWGVNMPRGDLLFCLRHLFGSKPDQVLQWVGEVERFCRGESSRLDWFFILWRSQSRMQQLRVELAGAKDDPDGIKRALALAKIDEIVAALLKQFEHIACSYAWLKANELSLLG